MPVRIGYLLPTREQVMEGRPETAPLLSLAEKAEGLGWEFGLGRRLRSTRPATARAIDVAVGGGRAPTQRAELGTAVLLPALRNPVVLAHGVATLDQISEGRFIMGVGIASNVANIRAEFVACGVPFEKRVGRMLEGLRLCRELWGGKPVTWNGRWVLDEQAIGPTPHRPGRAADLDRRHGCKPAWSGSAGSTMAGSRIPPIRCGAERAMGRDRPDCSRGGP